MRSAVHLTPLLTPVLIDGEAVRELVAAEYAKAGFSPADVDTGAVIITGESARKENAAAVLGKLSAFAGEFVVSTAGPNLESVIAGKGSGAYRYSLETGYVTANLDVGGGTTNIVIFDGGETVSRGCFDIGGRLIRLTPELVVETSAPRRVGSRRPWAPSWHRAAGSDWTHWRKSPIKWRSCWLRRSIWLHPSHCFGRCRPRRAPGWTREAGRSTTFVSPAASPTAWSRGRTGIRSLTVSGFCWAAPSRTGGLPEAPRSSGATKPSGQRWWAREPIRRRSPVARSTMRTGCSP